MIFENFRIGYNLLVRLYNLSNYTHFRKKTKSLLTNSRLYVIMIIDSDKWKGVEMEENKKMGRPLTSEEARTIRFTVRFDKAELDELNAKAKKNNMKSAEYIRYLIKKEK